MSVQALNTMMQAAAVGRHTPLAADDFSRHVDVVLARAAEGRDAEGLKPDEASTLREASEQLVAISFIQPMLEKMRDDPFKSDLFHGGRAEEIFGQQLDTILSERIVARADFSVVDAVYRSIAQQAAQRNGAKPELNING